MIFSGSKILFSHGGTEKTEVHGVFILTLTKICWTQKKIIRSWMHIPKQVRHRPLNWFQSVNIALLDEVPI